MEKKEFQIFNSEQFGLIRTTGTPEEPLFCLIDVCKALGIVNNRNVRARLDDDDVRLMDAIDNMGRVQQVAYVSEPGLYEVIIRSDSERAKPFRKWVTSEVLPSIRKTGMYATADFMSLATDAPLLSGDEITRAISGLDVLVMLAKRQRKLLEKMEKLQYAKDRIMEHNRELSEKVKQLQSQCDQMTKRIGRRKGGAS